jgi:hypothetical protein
MKDGLSKSDDEGRIIIPHQIAPAPNSAATQATEKDSARRSSSARSNA